MSLNKAMVIGNLGDDPEVRSTGAGQTVATLRVATNERWTDKSGQQQERTEWHRIVVWGKQAEMCREYLSKGRQIFAEGRIQTREWNDKEGNRRFTTEIVAQRIQFLGGRGGNGGGGSSMSAPDSMPTPPMDGGDEDIPF